VTYFVLIVEAVVKNRIIIHQSCWLDSFLNYCSVSEEQLKMDIVCKLISLAVLHS